MSSPATSADVSSHNLGEPARRVQSPEMDREKETENDLALRARARERRRKRDEDCWSPRMEPPVRPVTLKRGVPATATGGPPRTSGCW